MAAGYFVDQHVNRPSVGLIQKGQVEYCLRQSDVWLIQTGLARSPLGLSEYMTYLDRQEDFAFDGLFGQICRMFKRKIA